MQTPHLMSGGRYPVLRSLAIIYVIAAALAAVATVIGVIWALAAGDGAGADRLIMAAAALGGGFLLVITMLAVAEVLKLFIDVEHNTRVGASAPMNRSVPVSADAAMPESARVNRLEGLDDEPAEVALIRGH